MPESTRFIICPHCGHATPATWESGEWEQMYCDKCGKVFALSLRQETTYQTAVQQSPKGKGRYD